MATSATLTLQCQGRSYNRTPLSCLHSPNSVPEVTLVLSPTEKRRNTRKDMYSNESASLSDKRRNLDTAMETLNSGTKTGCKLDFVFYNSLVSRCISEKALQEGIQVHSHMASTGYKPGIFLENQLINLYAKCGEMGAAQELFDGMCQRNSVSWNAMIAGYCLNQQFQEALHLFRLMTETGPQPNKLTYLSVLRATTSLGNPRHGEQIHSHLIRTGSFNYTQIGNALINMYAKLGNLENAESVYKNMAEKDEVTWNSIIAANAQNGCSNRATTLFLEMQRKGLRPDEFAFGSILRSRGANTVKELHAQIIKSGYQTNVFIGTGLLDAYASCGNIKNAHLVFSKMHSPNIISWNTIIAVCLENGCVDDALQLFLQMREKDIHPDDYTLSSLIKAAATRPKMEEGKQLHVLAIKLGLHKDVLVGNTVINMYSKHRAVRNSKQAFRSISEPDVISWNTLIQAHAENERPEEAIAFFQDMRFLAMEPDEFTFTGVLAACTMLCWLKTGKAIHGCLVKIGLVINASIGSALVDMYAKCGAILDAEFIFDEIEHKDLITWNSMIDGLAHNGRCEEALEIFCLLWEDNLEPDHFTFASLLSGCAEISAVEQGKQLHSLILKSGVTKDVAVANSLITMYGSVGSIKEAKQVFEQIPAKSTITWNTMIRVYAHNGSTEKVLELINQMEGFQVKPNGITFTSLLMGCSYAGLIEQAKMFFKAMKPQYGIIPGYEHYACMVDILGRAGRLEEAEDFINMIPHEPDALVWRMLLSACRLYGDLDRGKRSMEKITALDPGDSAAYVLLSNLYAAQGNREGVIKVRKLMKENGVRKEQGKSWIEVSNTVHKFVAGDRSHPQANEIYSKLKELLIEMKLEGYVPDTRFINFPSECTASYKCTADEGKVR